MGEDGRESSPSAKSESGDRGGRSDVGISLFFWFVWVYVTGGGSRMERSKVARLRGGGREVLGRGALRIE